MADHAFICENVLTQPDVLKKYKILKTKTIANERQHIVLVENAQNFISDLQKKMSAIKPSFFHIYNNGITLTIVYKDKVFLVNPNNKNTWINAQRHGAALGIPQNRLDFFPTRIKEEE